MQVVVSCPGVMPAANQVARAFHERGMLARFETTFAHDPEGAIDRLLRAVPDSRLAGRLREELTRRAVRELPSERVRRHPFWDLARTVSARLGASDVWLDRLWERGMLDFDRQVAAGLGAGLDAIYGYEHACRASLTRARTLGLHRIFDMAAPHYAFMERVLASEIAEFPAAETAHYRATRAHAERRNAHKQAEFELAELVIANSRFTARTLTDTGYPADRVRVVPLGAPAPDRLWRTLEPPTEPRFLFAGQVSVHKGAHHLLEAWTRLEARNASLTLAGRWGLPESSRQTLAPSVRVLGNLAQPALFEQYATSSVLVFPSLCDGFGMVVTEALAHGLPVIVTTRVGAADLIEEDVNGWVLEPGDIDALVARMQFCIEQPEALQAMRPAAEQSAARNQWLDYRQRLAQTVCDFFGARSAEAP